MASSMPVALRKSADEFLTFALEKAERLQNIASRRKIEAENAVKRAGCLTQHFDSYQPFSGDDFRCPYCFVMQGTNSILKQVQDAIEVFECEACYRQFTSELGKVPTNRERELVGYLFYEVDMLAQTMQQLAERDFHSNVASNALIESFCIHARNLSEFFLENGKDDTLRASAFCDSEYEKPENSPERQMLITKINKQIAHITKRRTSRAEEKINDEDRHRLAALLLGDLQRFSEHIKANLRSAWKVTFVSDPNSA